MTRISSILARKGSHVFQVSPDTSVLKALEMMAEKNIGSVAVMQDGVFAGIVTERDYSRKVILRGKHSVDTTVADIMSSQLPSLQPGDSVEHCMALMTQNNIRYIPVFDKGQLAGIISMSDVVKETILSQKETIDHLQNYIAGQG